MSVTSYNNTEEVFLNHQVLQEQLFARYRKFATERLHRMLNFEVVPK